MVPVAKTSKRHLAPQLSAEASKRRIKFIGSIAFEFVALGMPARATDTPTKPRILSLLQVRAFKAQYAEGSAAVIDLYQR
ncbi:MAG: hypothetical protein WBZ16_05955, partial [Pseudolabrys sp.]